MKILYVRLKSVIITAFVMLIVVLGIFFTAHSPNLFRAPSGSYDNKTISAAENLGMVTIQWDVEPLPTVKNGYK